MKASSPVISIYCSDQQSVCRQNLVTIPVRDVFILPGFFNDVRQPDLMTDYLLLSNDGRLSQ